MVKLSVNVNKIATLRNARGQDTPNLLQMTRDIIKFGADGITIHPRPDERHIKRIDAEELSLLMAQSKSTDANLEFNIEGYPSDDFMQMVLSLRPDQCTLVPDPPDVITSNAGWKLPQTQELLSSILSALKAEGIRSSLFMDPDDNSEEQFIGLESLKPDRIELYTENFAKGFDKGHLAAILSGYQQLALQAKNLGIGVNAGHDLNQKNLKTLIDHIPEIEEVSIGHALICESLYEGLQQTLKNYQAILSGDD